MDDDFHKKLFLEGDPHFKPIKMSYDIETEGLGFKAGEPIFLLGAKTTSNPKSQLHIDLLMKFLNSGIDAVFESNPGTMKKRYDAMHPMPSGDIVIDSLPKDHKNHVINEIKIGRNDKCGCGSGKKFKFCCLKRK